MEIDRMMRDAYSFTRTALADQPARWIALAILWVVPVLNLVAAGYLARVFGGENEPPDLDDIGQLFVDGLRLAAVSIVYLIGISFIVLLIAGGTLLVVGGMAVLEDPFVDFSILGLVLAFMSIGVFYLLVAIASVAIIAFSLIYFMALVRAARTRSIGQAFAVGEILEQVREIGWLNYLSVLLLLNFGISLLAYATIGFGLLTIGIGLLLVLPLVPALGIFIARSLSSIYDCKRAVSTPPAFFSEGGGNE